MVEPVGDGMADGMTDGVTESVTEDAYRGRMEVLRRVGRLVSPDPQERVAACDEVRDAAASFSARDAQLLAMNAALAVLDEKDAECREGQLTALVALVETSCPDPELLWPVRLLAKTPCDDWSRRSRRYLDHLLATLADPAAASHELIMECWKVRWHHDFEDEPTVLYSEIGPDGYEARKVEEFRDGRLAWADQYGAYGGAGLGEIPVGSIEEVRAQEEFTADVIACGEFRRVWGRALREGGRGWEG
ncbi:hypothetical protein LHJ74_03920 [Streptomyces sp. N2-109]|uniref:DUF6881 domain-containing protein n=1 Tax=Streptomyces gossypii TaxID=2883101 RepID=A0ABT2JMX4_9ACTN|nr:hypothetical protein [Streptomyces gossypii]MCT2589091.1 hypothetical protein [Streptomyces gossypii]